MWTRIFNPIFPGTCSFCQENSGSRLDLCQFCVAELPKTAHSCFRCALPLVTPSREYELCSACLKNPPPVRQSLSCCLYAYPADRLVHGLKFNNELKHARTMGLLLSEAVEQFSFDVDQVFPIPLSDQRYLSRGFNQASEIARFTCRSLDKAFCSDTLVRAGDSHEDQIAQTKLDRHQRQLNIRGAFTCHKDLSGVRCALVDDVMTTGATVYEAALVLLQAGAKSVDVWVFARTP